MDIMLLKYLWVEVTIFQLPCNTYLISNVFQEKHKFVILGSSYFFKSNISVFGIFTERACTEFCRHFI